MADYEKPLIHVVDASGNKVPATVAMLTSGGGGGGGGGGGDASAANQIAGNTSLASIDTKTPALGQALAASSTPVVLPASQITALTPPTTVGVNSLPALSTGSNAIGSITNTSFGISGTLPAFTNTPTFNIGTAPTIAVAGAFYPAIQPVSGTITANLGTIAEVATATNQATANTSLASIDTKTPALGQALAAASTPVVLPAAQITALTPLSTIAATQSGNWNIGSITTLPSLPTGANTIGAISNTAFSINGTLPAFATTPTFNLGTGAISNTSFAATQSGAWNITNISGTVSLPTGASTSALQTTGNTSLSSIDTKTPVLGQALAAASTPVVLPASQITALTPPTSVGLTGTLPAFATTPTFNLGTAPNLTFTNTSFIANAGTNLNTSALALESGGNLAGINTKLPSNLTVSATRLLVDGSGVTQPVSMAAAPAGLAWESTATITRAANTTAYTANDVYGGVFELTNIGASGGFVFLNSLHIIFNITALPSGMGAFAVYLFNATPPSAITDNLPYSLSSGDTASIVTLDGLGLTASLARGGGRVVAEALNINQLFKLATGSTSLWGYLVTLSAFTPAANSETAIIRARSFAP